ncbi:SDR family NAD(P)-dependent oxidoreductase [Sphingobacterium suaedae]|uniref:SDR family NAD(P)-dependent oxidoreductase n=1 Tax=Sphingobacterium suaedae TaxID=1686402 RepID=A0ABW5KL18_9SPHI
MSNKIALVTGGNKGLGRDMAINLAKKGLDVIITYHSNQELAKQVTSEIGKIGQKAIALELDMTVVSGLDLFVASLTRSLKINFGTDKIDYLVNNAGFIYYVPYSDVSLDQFDDLLNIHFKGPFFLTQKLLRSINDNGGVVNVSTGLARFSTPGFATYASMKGAIETLTKYQAQELGKRGIRANVIAPGPVETDIMGGAVRDNKEMNANLASQTALGRVGVPHDIGGVVAFLCTDDAKWINGQRIEISGGYNL